VRWCGAHCEIIILVRKIVRVKHIILAWPLVIIIRMLLMTISKFQAKMFDKVFQSYYEGQSMLIRTPQSSIIDVSITFFLSLSLSLTWYLTWCGQTKRRVIFMSTIRIRSEKKHFLVTCGECERTDLAIRYFALYQRSCD